MTSPVLQVGPLPPMLERALQNDHAAHRLPDDPGAVETFLAEHAEEVRVLVTAGVAGVRGIDADLIAALPGLAAIAHCAVGYDNTDLHAAAARGIAVSNTPDVLTDCVADAAVGLMIDLLRGFSAADRYVRAGRWATAGPFPLTQRVSGARVGILGLGRIGTAIADRLRAFDCTISYHNRHPVPGSAHRYLPSPIALARAVDVLIVAAPGGAATHHLVDAAVLAALGPHGYLVNIARGSLIDEGALIRALRDGGIAGAGLDVFADEPNVPAELRSLDNAVLLPHLASATEQTRAAMSELTLRNVTSFLATGTLITPVPLPGG
ncbi:MAG TPA: 2-hydroxyacid dehydrogenase [Mycobacterium sp.]|nr:2-hydroxyacid dehydrogenase [Mycobacterium sp.]